MSNDRKTNIEIHFQEGLFEERINIFVSGKIRHKAENLTTKLMLGLAEIVTLEVETGELIEIRGLKNLTIGFNADNDNPYVTISKEGAQTKIEFTNSSLGYV